MSVPTVGGDYEYILTELPQAGFRHEYLIRIRRFLSFLDINRGGAET